MAFIKDWTDLPGPEYFIIIQITIFKKIAYPVYFIVFFVSVLKRFDVSCILNPLRNGCQPDLTPCFFNPADKILIDKAIVSDINLTDDTHKRFLSLSLIHISEPTRRTPI